MYEVNDGVIIRLSDGAHIPIDLDNKDYQEYLEYEKGVAE